MPWQLHRALDPTAEEPLFLQIVRAIAADIGAGRLVPGTRLPSRRIATLLEQRRWPELKTLRYFVSAAAPLARATAETIWSRHSARFVQGYGLTESTNFATLLPVDLSDAEYRHWMLKRDIPSIGAEIFGNQVAILDRDGMPLEHRSG